MRSRSQKAPLSIYQFPDAEYITDDIIEKAEELFRLALKNSGNKEYRSRISREYLAVRYIKLARLPLNTRGRWKMIREFFGDVRLYGLTEIMERRSLECSEKWMLESRYAKERPGAYSLYYIMQ